MDPSPITTLSVMTEPSCRRHSRGKNRPEAASETRGVQEGSWRRLHTAAVDREGTDYVGQGGRGHRRGGRGHMGVGVRGQGLRVPKGV